jgi:hypothetical protein
VNNADARDIQGLAVTGVGTVDCARHNMKQPNSISDLQLGEKYDMIFLRSEMDCNQIYCSIVCKAPTVYYTYTAKGVYIQIQLFTVYILSKYGYMVIVYGCCRVTFPHASVYA